MPWDGYNYEDAIVINERLISDNCLTSIHIEEYETLLNYNYNYGTEKLTKQLLNCSTTSLNKLNKNGIVKLGAFIKSNDILVGKLVPKLEELSPELKLLNALYGLTNTNYKNQSLYVPAGINGRVIDIRILSKTFLTKNSENVQPYTSEKIKISIACIKKIQIGDKLAGRHGNKGIISKILSKQDMPYLADGTPIDILLNPLGVPSRMNVGQIFECLLGLAGKMIEKRFKIIPFDEVFGREASRILINQKLKEASLNKKWIFNSYAPGKLFLKDGQTGEFFDNPVTVGYAYILKLIHCVADKIHARSNGPYSLVTEQPLAGKAQKGGQRFGEMEVWALEAFGCANTLQELLTIKSDDIDGRNDWYKSILYSKKETKPEPFIPEAFFTLIRELNALGLDFSLKKIENIFENQTLSKTKASFIFQELEEKLKLRALANRKKII